MSLASRLGAAAVVTLAPALAAAQGEGVVVGRVTARPDSGAARPAAGAAVSVGALAATANADGRFVIARVPAGAHVVRVRLLGWRTAEQPVRVRAGDTARVEVALRSEVQRLATVRTDARSADAEAFAARPNVASVTVTAAQMAGVPSVGEPDVIRVVQLLPGVAARNDFNTGLNVRGGEADQNLVLLDGFAIHNPFHLGGLFSTFMDATVGSVELLTGAFPARYGGRLSSVLDVRSADDARRGVHTTLDVSALAATGRLAGALGGGRGAWSVAGRRTYADAVTSAFSGYVFPYHFQDAQGRLTYALPGGARLAVTAYAGRDVLDADFAEFQADSAPSRASEGTWAVDWGNKLLGASVTRDVGRLTVEQRASVSAFSTRLDLGGGAATQRSRVTDLALAGSATARAAAHEPSLGYEVTARRVRYGSGSVQTGTTDFDIRQRPVTGALYASDLWRVTPRLLVEGGVRAEALNTRRWAALSPRLSVKVLATPNVALTAAGGRVTQTLHSLAGDGPLRFFDVWVASDSFVPVGLAWHGVAGVERRFGDAGSLKVEGYVKRYDRTLEANWSDDPARRGDEFFQAEGRSYGLDVLARWQRGAALAGWVAYSYGVSERWRDTLRWAPGHDRRHDVDAVATWRVRHYRFGARFGYATGTPFTPIVGEVARRIYDPSRDRWGTGDPRVDLESLGGARNAARYPASHRLDLDVSREFRARGATVAPYVSVVNAYNAHNVFVYLYQYATDTPNRRTISQFPVLPSLGARVAF